MNSIDSESREISRAQMRELIDASTFAWRMDMRLTRFTSINLKRADIRPQKFISDYTKLAGDWLRTQGITRAYLWVIEHPPAKSLNIHLLIHVPDHLLGAFARKERGWLKQAGVKWAKGILNSKRIGRTSGRMESEPTEGEYIAALEGLVGYLIKGGSPKACADLRIDHKWQGNIRGKRACTSEAIGKAARVNAGYRPPICERGAILFRRRYRL